MKELKFSFCAPAPENNTIVFSLDNFINYAHIK